MTADETTTHESEHATYDPRCEPCLKLRGLSSSTQGSAKAAYFDYATVKNSQQGAEVKILVGAGPRGETFARGEQNSKTLSCFLDVLLPRYGNIPVYCDLKRVFA